MAILLVAFLNRLGGDNSCIWFLIRENLRGITAEESDCLQLSPGLIKDYWIMPLHPKTSEMAEGQEDIID